MNKWRRRLATWDTQQDLYRPDREQALGAMSDVLASALPPEPRKTRERRAMDLPRSAEHFADEEWHRSELIAAGFAEAGVIWRSFLVGGDGFQAKRLTRCG